MSSRPLSYDGLKCVLQHMEPSKRFQVANQCPSIRTAERVTPLKLSHLMFSEGKVQINKTTFKMGIVREYNIGEVTPATIASENESGGVQYEVDKFGVKVRNDEYSLTPGDVKIEFVSMFPGHTPPREKTTEQMIAEVKEYIRRYEYISYMRDGQNPEYSAQLQRYQVALSALEYRRDNVTPPYRNFLKFTIETPGKQAIIERYEHNKRFSEAMKHLGEYFFGRRRGPIYVRHFQLDCQKIVLRVPLRVKFHIGKLEFETKPGPTLDSMSQIIHKSSYPLSNLIIRAYEVEDVTHLAVREAQALQLNTIENHHNPFFPIFTSVSNNKLVHINHTKDFDFAYLLALIENLITTNREVGTEFLFHRHHLKISEMVRINEKFNGKFNKQGHVVLPMTTISQLCIRHAEIAGLDGTLERGVRLSVIAKL